MQYLCCRYFCCLFDIRPRGISLIYAMLCAILRNALCLCACLNMWAMVWLGWVPGAPVTLQAMWEVLGKPLTPCRLCPPSNDGYLVEQKKGESWMAISCKKCAEFSQRRWNRTRESSNTKGVKSAELAVIQTRNLLKFVEKQYHVPHML